MRALFGPRLEGIVLRGSRSQDAGSESSDVDLIVLLDAIDDYWAEFDRISPIANRVSLEHDVLISAFPAAATDFRAARGPFLANARERGTPVG